MIKETIDIKHLNTQQVYDILMDSELHGKLTGEKAKINNTVGGEFSTFGGYSSGQNLELIEEKLIRQTWRADDWPKEVFSTIVFKLITDGDGTRIDFEQEGVPEGREDEYRDGWRDFYWEPLQKFEM